MKFRFFIAAAILSIATLVTGCGKSEEQVRAEVAAEAASKAAIPAISFQSLEIALMTARENSLTNAQEFRTNNPEMSDYDISPNGDSTQSNECPQGDGWATLTFTKKAADGTRDRVRVKCSTVSAGLGCQVDSVFKTKSYAKDDGKCQPTTKVPYPLPRVGGK